MLNFVTKKTTLNDRQVRVREGRDLRGLLDHDFDRVGRLERVQRQRPVRVPGFSLRVQELESRNATFRLVALNHRPEVNTGAFRSFLQSTPI